MNHFKEKCPRCDDSWTREYSCQDCKLTWFPTNDMIMLHINKGNLYWIFDMKPRACDFHSIDKNGSYHTILPWFDFKITSDRLKLHLTFQ